MKVTYKPGKNPADPHAIKLFANGEELENITVLQARNKKGLLTLTVEIVDCEAHRESRREIYTRVHEEPGTISGGSDRDTDQTPIILNEGTAYQRDNLPSGKRRNRDKGKD